jgi:2-hydroxychromene-2-carboxylate isomerase
MDKVIDYYLFVNSPWTYLGHKRFADIARAAGARIRVRPMDAAKVFPVSGGLPLAQRPKQRQAYRIFELKRWRDYLGVPLNIHPKYFPSPTDTAARMVVAASDDAAPAAAFDLAGRLLAAVWTEERNIADEPTLIAIANEAGLDGAALLASARSDATAARYAAYTQEAIDRQVFGAPTYFYRDEPFWGQDRLDFLQRALAR